jgi:hypothetical protein
MLLYEGLETKRMQVRDVVQINLPSEQQEAITALDTRHIDQLIRQSIKTQASGSLSQCLAGCGSYISNELYYFDRALARHRKAIAPKKRAETQSDAERAGYALSHAVSAMKHRVEEDRKFAELFFVEDHVWRPSRFTSELSVPVSFRWRRTTADEWTYGGIRFDHTVEFRPNFAYPRPKRKPSANKQEQERQRLLGETWDHLLFGALCSVRDFFRAGGSGDAIPEVFQATVSAHTRDLNNYSTQFWRQEPDR